MSKEKWYVVHAVERLRDGREEWARVVCGLDDAIAMINQSSNGFTGCNTDYQVFELGKEIPLEIVKEEEPQPAKVKTKFRVKGKR